MANEAASSESTVFVLGAGFTKAFLPMAPLMEDDYDGEALAERFRPFRYASRILERELNRDPDSRINIERLMTRLDGRMPYDSYRAAEEELLLLLSEVKRAFICRLEKAKQGHKHLSELTAFARYCLENEVTCVTFNYDDVLDERLCSEAEFRKAYWHPDVGYGFLCRPSWAAVGGDALYVGEVSMALLKLHGSVNWLPIRGYPRPYAVDAIMHQEGWFSQTEYDSSTQEAINLHLESDPFIVPPVLLKSALVEQPILRACTTLIAREGYAQSEAAIACEGGIWPRKATLRT